MLQSEPLQRSKELVPVPGPKQARGGIAPPFRTPAA